MLDCPTYNPYQQGSEQSLSPPNSNRSLIGWRKTSGVGCDNGVGGKGVLVGTLVGNGVLVCEAVTVNNWLDVAPGLLVTTIVLIGMEGLQAV